ncbi:hypothetical protein ACJ41O_010915 [Fusarium nematophilum]
MEIQPDSVFLRSCPLCDKVYTQEHSYSRHIKYCRRAQTKRKGRPKSCITCSKAKAKCSFAQPCSRCEKKGIECAYQSSHADSVSALQRPHQWPWAGDGNYQTNVDAYAELSGFLELPVELGDLASGSMAQSELELVNFGLADQQANPRRPYRNTNKEIIHLPYGAPNLHQAANLILQTLGACLWVIISCVLSIDDDIPCAGCSTLQDLPLPSNKMLWEARSSEEWQVERAFDGVSSPMTTLGELVLAKRDATDPLHAQRLQTWEVGSDKMAVMLNIATEDEEYTTAG